MSDTKTILMMIIRKFQMMNFTKNQNETEEEIIERWMMTVV